MKILIDFTQIPVKKVGVGVYALNTFSEMFKAHPECEFYTLTQNDDDELDFKLDNVKNIRLKAKLFRSIFLRSIVEQFYIPHISRKYRIDIIHSLHYSFPLIKTKARKIITIHDLTFFIYPKLHQFVKRYYFRWFIKQASFKLSNTLICVSKSTLEDLNKYVPNNRSNNYIVPLACENKKIIPRQSICEKFHISRPYIIFIGTLEPRKNIEGLIKAYALSKENKNYQLVVVGKKGWYYDTIFELVKNNNLSRDIIFTGFVTSEEKYGLLKQSSLFIYPSFYEGFGLPVLEAMSMGIPTITSNISSLPEVGGTAAKYVNPNDIKGIAEVIDLVLDDEALRNKMIEEGYKQAAKFSWGFTAEKTFDIYKNALVTC